MICAAPVHHFRRLSWRTASVALGLAVLGLSPACAQQAQPPDRCSGTLCDLYYGGPAPEQPEGASKPPTAPTPMMVPSFGRLIGGGQGGTAQGGASGAKPLVGVGGDGIASLFRGDPQDRCTGTLCDMYYGGPPPEKPEPQPGAQAPQPTVEGAAAPAEPDPDDTPGVRYEPREEKPHCVAPPQDPWKCYR